MAIKKSSLLIFILLIPIFRPALFTQYSILVYLYISMNLIEFAFLCSKLFTKNGTWSKILVVWILIRLYMLFIGIINNNIGGILQWGYLSLMMSNLIMIFDFYGEKYFLDIVKLIALISVGFLLLNYLTLLIFPRGIIRSSNIYDSAAEDFYLLGIKTSFTTFMFPAIVSSGVYYILKKNAGSKILLILAILSCLLNALTKSISTALLGIMLIIVLIALSSLLKFKYKGGIILLIALFAHLAIVVFRLQNLFEWLIVDVLGKDLTLSARVYIWNSALNIFINQNIINIIFGNGLFEQNAFVPYSGAHWQPHNQMLTLLYTSGLIGTLLFGLFILLLLRGNTANKATQFSLIVCTCVLVLSITEVYFDVAVCYVPFLFVHYLQKKSSFIKNENSDIKCNKRNLAQQFIR